MVTNTLFEIKKNGVTRFFTLEPKCIPEAAKLRDIERAGHAFYINGKRMTIKKIGEMLNAENR